MIFRELGKFQAFLTRNTDTITNTYVRKLTSIALMAIMVGGGLTFAIPGMEPAHAAQISTNPHLKVSAEGQNADNEIGPTNIVEVVVIDDLTDDGTNSPIVKVNGITLPMYPNSGGWYGYFADTDIRGTGLLADGACPGADDPINCDAAMTAHVSSAPASDNDARTVHLFDLDGDFDVVYERPGADETVSMEADNPDSGVSLGRANYPQSTSVVITIDDQALNVDPTGEDVWVLATNSGDGFYEDIENFDALNVAATDRDALIDSAKATRESAFTDVEFDDPAEALATLKKQIARAAVVIETPRIGLTGEPDDTVIDNLIRQYGQGDRDTNQADVDTNTPIADLHKDFKGTLLMAHEEEFGLGERTSTETDSKDYKGTSLIAFEEVAGRGDGTSNEESSADYKGSAVIAFERVDGSGEKTFTPADGLPIEADETVPKDYRGSAWIAYDIAAGLAIDRFTGQVTDGPEPFDIADARNLLQCTDGDACTDIAGIIWMTFTEDGDNNSVFNNAPGGTPNIETTASAPRGLSFSVEYDNSASSGIGYSTANIVIDAGAEWNSGQEIGITLTDSDANTNSLDADDLDVSDPSHIIPTITIGNPDTLAGDINVGLTGTITGTDEGAVVEDGSQRMTITTGGTAAAEGTIIFTISHRVDSAANTYRVVNYDLSAFEFEGVTLDYAGDDDAAFSGTVAVESDTSIPATFTLTFAAETAIPEESAIAIDIFTFGYDDVEKANINNAIYRLELAEDGDDSSDFTGTLEYIGLNQINIVDEDTYKGIDALGDSIILVSDDDSISVEYLDLDSTGGTTLFTAEADTPTHSGSVSLDSDGYKVSDTVTVTVEDADLNADSGRADVYTAYGDKIRSSNDVVPDLFTISINSQLWADVCSLDEGLGDSEFTLRETGSATGVFTGTFSVPAEYCDNSGTAATVTGTDISVKYTDFRDDSGSTISVSASAGIRSTTASVSLDRTVYPVPFSGNSYETHSGEPLPEGKLTVYVSINDADFDISSNGIDSLMVESEDAPLKVSVIRGSDTDLIAYAGNTTDNAISETAPDSGVFEYELEIAYNSPVELSSSKCPVGMTDCILQGDILHVEYNDPSDASGSANTVTDSATFDLRNAVLQSDQTAYIIGSGMILTLIEPDLNLDSSATETYPLTLLEWDSDAGTEMLNNTAFDATPSNLLETGTDTGIFQVVVEIPQELGDDDDKLERGEEITLEYVDWSPSGSDYVGDKDQSITTTVYTSNFGATIELDQRVYTWTDKVYVTVVAPDHNIDSDQVDEIGNDPDYPIRVSTRGNDIDEYKLVETGADTGIFTGEIILTGFKHDADGDTNFDADGRTSLDGSGPTDGLIGTESESGISVSFKYSDGETVSSSALIRWNVGEVQWLEASYPASGSGIVRVIDPDMNTNPEAVDNFDIIVWSDSDGGGIELTVTETNAATGIFEGTVFFGVGVDTSGHRLRVVEGDTVTAQYYDNTLPAPFKETERVRVGATTLIGTIVPPLERVPISDLRAVDSFGSTLDTISVDSQIQLAADLTNGQDKSQDFAYLIQIQDGNGVTVSLNWITGSLTEGQSLSPATSWTPTEAGTYEVTAFAWESIENPTALSPTSTITITVN